MLPNGRLYPDCFKLFVQTSGRVRTPATEEAVMIHMRALQAVHPKKGVRDFTGQDLTNYCLSKGAAPNTVKTRRALLHSFFEWAHFAGLVAHDPSSNLKFTVQPGNHTVRRHTWLSSAEFRKLLTELPTSTLVKRRDRMLVFTGLLTGLRSSNLSSLKWSQFSRDLGTVQVTSKGQRLKDFGIPDLLRSSLVAWRAELAPHQGADGPVFPRFRRELGKDGATWQMSCQYNTAVQHQGAQQAISRATTKCLGMRMRPHDLRRSYAAYLEDQGFDLKDISRALGHENMATTSGYLDRNPNRSVAVGRSLSVQLD